MLRLFRAVLVWLAALCVAASASDDAVRAISKLYAAVANDHASFSSAAIRARFFSKGFAAVADAIDKRELASHDAILDFDPILNTNGIEDTANLVIRRAAPDLVVATFGKGADRRSVAYRFVLEGGVWRIDDIQSVPGARGVDKWSVRTINDDDLKLRTAQH